MFRYYAHGYVNGNWLLEERKIGEYIEKNCSQDNKNQVESFYKGRMPVTAFAIPGMYYEKVYSK